MLLLVPLAMACRKRPPVTEIEIVPSVVGVGHDLGSPTTFELEARLWTGPATSRKSITESSGYDLKWTVSPSQSWLSVVSHHGHRAMLLVKPGMLPSNPAVVQVKAGSRSAESRIVPATTSDQDVLKAGYTGDLPPDAVVMHGIRYPPEDPCEVWLAPAFVRTGLVGKAAAACLGDDGSWGAAVLDPEHAVVMFKKDWTPGVDEVDAGPLIPIRSIPVAVRVVIGGPGDLGSLRERVRQFALVEIAATNAILRESRVGVELKVEDIQTITTSSEESVIADCLSGDALTPAGDLPGILHVYYVNSMGGANGLACSGTDALPQSTIYIGWLNHSATTLVHEVGHALGLTMPGMGHADDLPKFDAANVMASGYADTDLVWRSRFSVGQALRMNADSASWLNWARDAGGLIRHKDAPRLACQCGAEDPQGPCPRLRDDVARPRGGVGTSRPWDCYDLLRLPAVGAEQPVALVAGRRWRAPVRECSVVPGHWEGHLGGSYLQFGNLTRSGDCPSWAAVFFKGQGFLFHKLEEADGVRWSDGADQYPIDSNLLDPPSVSVHVYYPTSAESLVKDDMAEAHLVFGADNRTGLRLAFTEYPGDACPGGTEIEICYATVGNAKGTLSGTAVNVRSAHDAFAVSHWLGQALGLQAIPTGTPPFSNVMQTKPEDRAHKLTLGQVFRIHAHLRPADLPNCELQPTHCPSLSADVLP